MPKLTDLTVEYVSLVDRAAVRDPSNPTEPQKFLLWKRDGGLPDPIGGSMTDDEMKAAVAKAEQERDEAIAKATKAAADLEAAQKAAKKPPAPDGEDTNPEDGDMDDLNKADLPPAVRAALEKAEKVAEARIAKAEADAAAATAEAAESNKLAKAERDARLEREFITKAHAEFPHVPGDLDALGREMKRASETLSKEDYEAYETRLRAANDQIEKGDLFAELGRGGQPEARDGDDTFARKAEEIRKADPSLSNYEALRQAASADREAAARYLQSVR